MSTIRYLLLLLVMFACCSVKAQDNSKQIDSLLQIVSKTKDDSNKVKLMNSLSRAYTLTKPNDGLKWAKDAAKLAKKIEWEKGEALSLANTAVAYQYLSRFSEALTDYTDALNIYDRLNDKRGMASVKNSIGKIYMVQGRYPEALENSLSALKISEEVNDELLIGQCYANIAGVYFRQDKKDAAAENYINALRLFNKTGDKKGIGQVLSNIGAIHLSNAKYDTALVYLQKALQINEEIGAMDVAGMNIANIAGVYSALRKYNLSLVYSFKSLRMNEAMGDINNVGIDQYNIGFTYYQAATDSGYVAPADSLLPADKNAILKKAVQYLEKARETLLFVSGDINALQKVNETLVETYARLGNAQGVIKSFREYRLFQDSVFSIDNKLRIAGSQTDRAELEKEKQIQLNKIILTKKRNERIFFSIGIALLVIAVVFITRERRKSDKLLLNILPAEVADELKRKGNADAKYFDEVTVLFTDFVNFTAVTEKLSPQALVDELHTYFKAFDNIVAKYNIEKIKTVGDAYLAVSGLPLPDEQHAVQVVKAAIEILDFVHARKGEKGENTFDIRIGVHSGSVVAGIVGVKKFSYDVWGDTVNTAARMEQSSESGKINISQTTYDLVKDSFNCTYRGELGAKNKGVMAMYFVEAAKA